MVMCILCQEIGYTASPNHVKCKCGGKFKILKGRTIKNENKKSEKDRHEGPTHTQSRTVQWS